MTILKLLSARIVLAMILQHHRRAACAGASSIDPARPLGGLHAYQQKHEG